MITPLVWGEGVAVGARCVRRRGCVDSVPLWRRRSARSRNRRPVVEESVREDRQTGDDQCHDDEDASGAQIHARNPTPGRAGCGPSAGALELDAESLRGTPFPPDLAKATEPPHEHRVVGQRLGTVDDPAQQLVIAGGGDAEGLADRSLLRRPAAARPRARSPRSPFALVKPALVGCRCRWSVSRFPRLGRLAPPARAVQAPNGSSRSTGGETH